jgi:hypothetical protein
MDSAELKKAERVARARIEAEGRQIEEIRCIQKTRDAALCTVELSDFDGARQLVVTRVELSG